MRSVKRRFNNIIEKKPNWSSYLCFIETIKKQNFSSKIVKYYFNRLIDKNDYSPNEKREILKFLYKCTFPTSS